MRPRVHDVIPHCFGDVVARHVEMGEVGDDAQGTCDCGAMLVAEVVSGEVKFFEAGVGGEKSENRVWRLRHDRVLLVPSTETAKRDAEAFETRILVQVQRKRLDRIIKWILVKDYLGHGRGLRLHRLQHGTRHVVIHSHANQRERAEVTENPHPSRTSHHGQHRGRETQDGKTLAVLCELVYELISHLLRYVAVLQENIFTQDYVGLLGGEALVPTNLYATGVFVLLVLVLSLICTEPDTEIFLE